MATTSSFVGAAQIGRYFNVVSTASSSVLVIFIAGLISSGAFQGDPQLHRVVNAASSLDLGDAGLLAGATLLVGLTLHPLQFAFVQFLEGYWGRTRLAVLAMEAAAEGHTNRWVTLTADKAEADFARLTLDNLDSDSVLDDVAFDRQRRRLQLQAEESDRLLSKYPAKPHILPTSLGNRLRSAEEAAGRPWNLDAVALQPALTLVAQPRDDRYFGDTIAELDVAVRFCIIWVIATIIGTAALWRNEWWLLLPIATYTFAYISYKGAIVAAEEHGAAVVALVALNRFALYERLGLQRPSNTHKERRQNRTLMAILNGEGASSLNYSPPKDMPPAPSPQKPS